MKTAPYLISAKARRRVWSWPGLKATLALWVAAVFLCQFPGVAQTAGEYEIKAAFLFNFAKFVEWPVAASDDSSSPVVIGIVGPDPFGEVLPNTVADETVKGRRLKVRHYQPADDLAGCQVLFVSRDQTAGLNELLKRASARHILTVSESEDFLRQGGMINFVQVGKNVRFDICKGAVEEAGLKMSSKLLAVAHAVKGVP